MVGEVGLSKVGLKLLLLLVGELLLVGKLLLSELLLLGELLILGYGVGGDKTKALKVCLCRGGGGHGGLLET